MSTVVLQIGQCGNQIGCEFFRRIDASMNASSNPFVTQNGTLRSVNVDTEPKVIGKLRNKKAYAVENVITGNTGSGSNFALGYHGVRHNNHEDLVQMTLEATRREMEKCDQFCGVVLLHSLAGGTGSASSLSGTLSIYSKLFCVKLTTNNWMNEGLTSRLCLELRDAYPMQYLLSCAVAPCQYGESPLQHYNSLLTLSALQTYTDAIILLRNDDALKAASSMYDGGRGAKSISLHDVNGYISEMLAALFLPTDSLDTASKVSIGREPWDLIGSIAPMPSAKFIHTCHESSKSLGWEGLLKKLLSQFPQRNQKGEHYGSLAGVIVARGGDSAATIMGRNSSKILSTFGCAPWNPNPIDCWTSTHRLTKSHTSLTSAVNTSYVVSYLETLRDRATVMYDSGAYLHWFRKHMPIDIDLKNAFEDISLIIDSYHELLEG